MYSLYGQSGSSSLPSGGGVVDDAMLVDQGPTVNPPGHHGHHHHRHLYGQDVHRNSEDSPRNDRERESNQTRGHQVYQHHEENNQITDFEEFLHCRAGTSREVIAQYVVQGQNYEHLFNSSIQQPHEFYSISGFGPLVHQDHQSQTHRVCTSDTSAHLYPGNQNQPNPEFEQQRTYYNLSSATPELPTLYGGPSRPPQTSRDSAYYGNTRETTGAVGALGSLTAAGPTPPPTPRCSETGAKRVSQLEKNLDDGCATANIGHGSCTRSDTNEKSRRRKNNKIDGADDNFNGSRSEPLKPELTEHMETETTMMIDQGSSSQGHNYRQYHHYHHHHHHHHQRTQAAASATYGIPSDRNPDDLSPVPRKRKVSCHDDSGMPKESKGDDHKPARSTVDKKQNHSAIEKRRRDKMNTYITDLSAMVPMCSSMSRKMDKLTVLRIAVQHLKTILGTVPSYTEGHCKPSFLSDQELKTLILQAADGFVFAVGCDRGRILYVSESVSKTLEYTQGELLGQSWFDILHPKDIAKVKEQLSSSDLSPRDRLIDAKTMLPVKTDVPQGVSGLCPGARRSFYCRMKRKLEISGCGVETPDKDEADTSTGHGRRKQQNFDRKYCAIHCTGYLKSWSPAKTETEEQPEGPDGDVDGGKISCLVAVGRIQPVIPALLPGPSTPKTDPIEFVSRHAMDGKFLFVDQRATLVLGFLPQELVGTSMYEYYHHDDIPHLAVSHRAALKSTEIVTTRMYRFRTKDEFFVNLQSDWWSFRNPWTKEIDYMISKNFSVHCDTVQAERNVGRTGSPSVRENCNYFAQSEDGLERLIPSHVEMSKIGRRIADEVLDQNQRRSEDPRSLSSPNLNPAAFGTEMTTTVLPDNVCNIPQATSLDPDNIGPTYQPPNYGQTRNNGQLNGIANGQGTQSDEDMMEMIGGTALIVTPTAQPSDSSDEAAMAVIMNLLEADAGLGGPVDFSGLPWPLP